MVASAPADRFGRRLGRLMKFRDVINILLANGFVLDRQSGSHRQ
jgi:hypothetical protein